MAEGDRSSPDSNQPSCLGGIQRRHTSAQRRRRRGHRRLPAGVLGRSDQQQGLGVVGEATNPLQECMLDPVGQREPERERLCPRQLVRGQDRRQLDQCQRIATGPLEEAIAHLRVDRHGRALGQQGGHGDPVQAADLHVRDSGA
jgi:hypothetical protein